MLQRTSDNVWETLFGSYLEEVGIAGCGVHTGNLHTQEVEDQEFKTVFYYMSQEPTNQMS